MVEDTLREMLRKKVVEILSNKLSRELAEEIEKKLSYEDRGRILREYERKRRLSEETYEFILSKYWYKDLTSVLFGIPSEIRVYPEITGSIIGSGKSGVLGLRKHVRELGYSDDKFEEILIAVYSEIEKLARDPKYLELLAVASLKIGTFYLDYDCEKAENFLFRAYEVRTKMRDEQKSMLFDAILRLGSFYFRVKKVEKAKIAYRMARDLFGEISSRNVKSGLLEELGKNLGEI